MDRTAGTAPAGRAGRSVRRSTALAAALWVLAVGGIAALVWLGWLLRRAGRPDMSTLQVGYIPAALATVAAATIGVLLVSRLPRHPVGWLLVGMALGLDVDGLANSYATYGLVARPGSLPGASYLAGFSGFSFVIWLVPAGFALLLTPTGSLPSPRWRWFAWVAAVAPVAVLLAETTSEDPMAPDYRGNPLEISGPLSRVILALGIAGLVVVLASVFVSAWSMVLRYRRARGLERHQLQWLALAAALGAAAFLTAIVAAFYGRDPIVSVSLGTCVALVPLATGAAIARYRLYDIDRIVSRTLAYALLTVLLGLGYALVVLGLGRLLPQRSNLSVAIATLAVAALFQPVRRRIQRAVDRRFNRRRYDAAETIAAFSTRLRAQIDLDTLAGELLAVVDATMQPTRTSLWLRRSGAAPPPGRR
jgi:MFS family permease